VGLVGAGNVSTAVSVLIAPPLARAFGWVAIVRRRCRHQHSDGRDDRVHKEPDDLDKHASFKRHIACLYERRLDLQPDLR
jgi:NNP family nitrate/nitrite transporter-like MFS transporter